MYCCIVDNNYCNCLTNDLLFKAFGQRLSHALRQMAFKMRAVAKVFAI